MVESCVARKTTSRGVSGLVCPSGFSFGPRARSRPPSPRHRAESGGTWQACRSGAPGANTRILFSDCFARSTAEEVQDWESALIKIVERIDERGIKVHRNNGSAAHVPTANSNFQQQHKHVVDALESQLPGVYRSQNFRAKDKDTLTALIKAHGDSTFSTSGLPRNEARKKIMDTYHILKTNVVIKTVRELSQNDRVAIATYIILCWYNEYRA